MRRKSDGITIMPFPRIRRLMEDGGKLARKKHLVHGLYEMDVTETRRKIRALRARTGKGLSLLAYFMACLGRAAREHRVVLASRTWAGRLALYEDVDVNTMFEVDTAEGKVIRPHILRAVDRKTACELHEEIEAFRAGSVRDAKGRLIEWFVLLPGAFRRMILRMVLGSPRWLKALNGTVSLSSVGMFGKGGGWGLPVTNATLQITLGGLADRPVLVDGRLENHQHLCVTISFDHDIVDGAPAARFAQTLKRLVEGGCLLEEPPPG